MTAHELAANLLCKPDIEVGYFDGEGHWFTATGSRLSEVDEANWKPIGHEMQTGKMRPVVEVE